LTNPKGSRELQLTESEEYGSMAVKAWDSRLTLPGLIVGKREIPRTCSVE
jgi:hypothetical protein